jgi:hypothetical protein
MADLICPQCKAPISKEEVKGKCASTLHLFKFAGRNEEKTPSAVVIQCPNGHMVEVDCKEAE